jgi:hypothetical protein
MATQKFLFALLVAAVVVGGVIFYLHSASQQAQEVAQVVVVDFGQTLQDVSITAPAAEAAQAMGEYYAPYVGPDLLTQWESNTMSAPGREVSSPWPDHATVVGITDDGLGGYRVTGNVVYLTSEDITAGTVASVDPFTATVSKVSSKWMITAWSGGTD